MKITYKLQIKQLNFLSWKEKQEVIHKKNSKFPKKESLYNIKLELKDLYKQDIREKY